MSIQRSEVCHPPLAFSHWPVTKISHCGGHTWFENDVQPYVGVRSKVNDVRWPVVICLPILSAGYQRIVRGDNLPLRVLDISFIL